MFYFDILKAFFNEEIRYLIVGGLAVNLHGVPRVTNDLDVIISLEPDNINKIKTVMNNLGYKPRLPGVNPGDLSNREKLDLWIRERNMKVFSYYQPSAAYRQFNILLVHPLDFDEAFEHKTVTMAAGVEVNLVSVKDLIKMKEFSGRSQDLSDIDHLKRIDDEKTQSRPKGFSYYLEDEKLAAYNKLSTEDKLKWLEEINEFTRMFQTKKGAKVREMFKKGKI